MHTSGSQESIQILMAQLYFRVGDLEGNTQKIKQTADFALNNHIDLIVFPEMSLPGYPIQDLIFDRDFYESQQLALKDLARQYAQLTMIIGGFGIEADPTHFPKYQNAAYILGKGKVLHKIPKRLIPTYDVFDEKRYFWAGEDFQPVNINGLRCGIAICEDLWEKEYQEDVAQKLVENGAEVIISINGSPYHIGKQKIREKLIQDKSIKYEVPIFYLNTVGGQDELVFDGRSFIFNKTGKLLYRAPFCQSTLCFCNIERKSLAITPMINELQHLDLPFANLTFSVENIDKLFNQNEEIIQALAMNLRNYYEKTGVFDKIVLALSGGIDSAFTAYIAAQAINPSNITALLMPSKYSSEGSVTDSIKLCENLGITYFIIPIKKAHKLLEEQFDVLFTSPSEKNLDLSRQNVQARLRGLILMYYSNLYNALVISTGNKSEIATGYCTLYGDTNGGKNIPGDLYKTQLYEVCKWINRESEVIPQNIIEKPPSAELKPNQVDQDNLPPYSILDEILELRIDEGFSPREIIKMGYKKELVYKIEQLYTSAEFKRAQLAQTIKINKKTFGKGRKIPVLKKPTY